MKDETSLPDSEKDASLNNQKKLFEALRKESWPFPDWSSTPHASTKEIKDYENYFANLLRTRYIELESEFQITCLASADVADAVTFTHPVPKRIFNLLLLAKKELEQQPPNLLSVSSTLELVDRYLIWLYYPSILEAKIPRVLSLLEYYQLDGKEKFIEQLSRFSTDDLKKLNEKFESETELESSESALLKQLRSVLDEATSAINKKVAQEQINSGLQIERLKKLRTWGIVMLVLLFLVSPFISNYDVIPNLSVNSITVSLGVIVTWITFLALAIVGALGGFLSGLLQARSSRVTLTQYQENMLKLQLKPLIGALVSLVLSVLLSWQILPGVTVENSGSYVLFAFLSGFSERYFLRLLELKIDNNISGTTEVVE